MLLFLAGGLQRHCVLWLCGCHRTDPVGHAQVVVQVRRGSRASLVHIWCAHFAFPHICASQPVKSGASAAHAVECRWHGWWLACIAFLKPEAGLFFVRHLCLLSQARSRARLLALCSRRMDALSLEYVKLLGLPDPKPRPPLPLGNTSNSQRPARMI